MPDLPDLHSEIISTAAVRKQSGRAQSIDSVRKRTYKRVPSALTPGQQLEAIQSVRAGRNFHQVACELSCAPWVVVELWVRAEIRDLRKAA